MDYKAYKHLEFRRKLMVIIGAEIEVSDPASGKHVARIHMKGWKLREDIRVYGGESLDTELFRIHARQIIDFGATYDVIDSQDEAIILSARRKGLKSTFVRDHWELLDASGNALGSLQETSGNLALVRRYAGLVPLVGGLVELAFAFVPQTYQVVIGDATAATITHRKNPLIVKLALDTSMAPEGADPRIAVAMTSLLSVVDASKN